MLKWVLRAFAFFWILILCLGTLEYFSFDTHLDFLKFKQQAVQTGWYLPAFYSHIWGSSVILIVGFLQFIKQVYNRTKLHRSLGKVYVFGVLFFAAPGAYIMTFFIHRGNGVFSSFFLQNTLWIVFTIAAWTYAKRRNFTDHVYMMRRSYALAFAAVTLRFYIWMFAVLGNGIAFENNYLIIAF